MELTSRLAWLLRAVCAAQALAIAGWIAWRWTASPVQALAGAALIAAIAPCMLAIEFLLLFWVRKGDPTPRATIGELLRAWAGETADLARVFYGRLPFGSRTIPDHLDPSCVGRTGVVLIHGFVANRGLWNPWMQQMRQQRRACVAVNLEPVFGSIDDYAPIIEAAVRQVAQLTGRPPVLVCHSMGGLAARAWLRTTHGPRRIAHLVTIGSPHRGTWLGRFSSTPNGRQMRQQSAWLADLERVEAGLPLPPCTCWYSNCDNIVMPPSTATLPAARNRLLRGVAHVAMAFDPRVVEETFGLLESPLPGARK